MVKLMSMGIVVGVFTLTGCGEPPSGPDYEMVRPEQTQQITKKNPGTQRDSIHVVSVDYEQ